MTAQQLGKRAEDLAATYVEKLGWRLLTRNFSCGLGELDIVALDVKEKELVVIEVRYRTQNDVQAPEDSIGPKKLRTLINAGRVFVDKANWTGPWRIDLFALSAPPCQPETHWRLERFPNIAQAEALSNR
jgi:putative endonuclease